MAQRCDKPGLNEGGSKPKQAAGLEQIILPAKKHLDITCEATRAESGHKCDGDMLGCLGLESEREGLGLLETYVYTEVQDRQWRMRYRDRESCREER
jgi:hypothetical protein